MQPWKMIIAIIGVISGLFGTYQAYLHFFAPRDVDVDARYIELSDALANGRDARATNAILDITEFENSLANVTLDGNTLHIDRGANGDILNLRDITLANDSSLTFELEPRGLAHITARNFRASDDSALAFASEDFGNSNLIADSLFESQSAFYSLNQSVWASGTEFRNSAFIAESDQEEPVMVFLENVRFFGGGIWLRHTSLRLSNTQLFARRIELDRETRITIVGDDVCVADDARFIDLEGRQIDFDELNIDNPDRILRTTACLERRRAINSSETAEQQ